MAMLAHSGKKENEMDLLSYLLPFAPYIDSYGWLGGLWVWSVSMIAPWFFMLARLKHMGFTSKGESFKRLYQEFGLLTFFSVTLTALLGVVADAIFNFTTGTIIFREFPREIMFTSRVERWSEIAEESIGDVREGQGISRRNGIEPTDIEIKHLRHRERMGIRWKHRLNSIMPGHV
jgi:hypothetical protein